MPRRRLVVAVMVLAAATACAAKPVAQTDIGQTPAAVTSTTPTQKPAAAAKSTPGPILVDPYAAMTKNKLYTVGRVAQVSCSLPSARLTSKSAALARAQAILGCLGKAWSPLVIQAGSYVEPPKLVAYSRTKSAEICGYPPPANSNALYCPNDQTIYFDGQGYLEEGSRSWAEVDLLRMVSHEYGHHLQYLIGVGGLYDARWRGQSTALQLELTRRLELQATCFGAAFVGVNKAALGLSGRRLADWNRMARWGDESDGKGLRDHGSAKSVRSWTDAAFKSGKPGSCNTWAASPKRVG